MTATNHALTGAIIGLSLGNTLIAVPIALASHFVLDSLPHFGVGKDATTKSWFPKLLTIDILGCFILVAVLAHAQPQHWLTAAVAAFAATSPDFMWLPGFIRFNKGQPQKAARNIIMRFHAWIQWYQQPLGALVEAAWAFIAVAVLIRLV